MYVFSGQLAGQGFGKLRKEHFDKCCLFPLQIEWLHGESALDNLSFCLYC